MGGRFEDRQARRKRNQGCCGASSSEASLRAGFRVSCLDPGLPGADLRVIPSRYCPVTVNDEITKGTYGHGVARQ